jgi:hypothetical protein
MNSPKYAEIDKKSLPVLQVVFTGNGANDHNFPLYLAELKQVYEEKKQIAIIFDASKAIFPAISYQKMQAQWLKENKKLMQEYCVGTAYIIPSIVIRNVLKAIFAVQEQPVPYLVCKTMSEAKMWTSEQLKNNINHL